MVVLLREVARQHAALRVVGGLVVVPCAGSIPALAMWNPQFSSFALSQ